MARPGFGFGHSDLGRVQSAHSEVAARSQYSQKSRSPAPCRFRSIHLIDSTDSLFLPKPDGLYQLREFVCGALENESAGGGEQSAKPRAYSILTQPRGSGHRFRNFGIALRALNILKS